MTKSESEYKDVWDRMVFPDRIKIVGGISKHYEENDFPYIHLNDKQKRRWREFVGE